jgi:hypothetical protein
MQPKAKALRKRTQIAKSNKIMFLWVAGVSVVLGFSLVGIIFMIQMLLFNERVLFEKNKTISTLDENNKIVSELQKNVNTLNTNSALMSVKSDPDDQALQVVLDALPSDANSLALGASLQNKLLSGINGLSLNALQIDTVAGAESLNDNSTSVVDTSGSSDIQNEITFRFSVNGNETALKQVLLNLEKSIRTIDITILKIESQGSTRMLTVQGRAFYEPARNVELKEKTVK